MKVTMKTKPNAVVKQMDLDILKLMLVRFLVASPCDIAGIRVVASELVTMDGNKMRGIAMPESLPKDSIL